jgi:hypothetical protein
MAVVVIGHVIEKRFAIAIWVVRIEVARFPRTDIGHEVVAMSQPNLLLPSNYLWRLP